MSRKRDSIRTGSMIATILSVAAMPTFWIGTAQAQPFDELVVFGDSISDTGNVYAYYHEIPPHLPTTMVVIATGPFGWSDSLNVLRYHHLRQVC